MQSIKRQWMLVKGTNHRKLIHSVHSENVSKELATYNKNFEDPVSE